MEDDDDDHRVMGGGNIWLKMTTLITNDRVVVCFEHVHERPPKIYICKQDDSP